VNSAIGKLELVQGVNILHLLINNSDSVTITPNLQEGKVGEVSLLLSIISEAVSVLEPATLEGKQVAVACLYMSDELLFRAQTLFYLHEDGRRSVDLVDILDPVTKLAIDHLEAYHFQVIVTTLEPERSLLKHAATYFWVVAGMKGESIGDVFSGEKDESLDLVLGNQFAMAGSSH